MSNTSIASETFLSSKKISKPFWKLYKPITLLDLLHSVSTGEPVPRHAFLLTFDDGFREITEIIAPLLLRKGIPATFFLATAFLDNKEMALHNKFSVLIEHINKLPRERQREISDILSKDKIQIADISAKSLSSMNQRETSGGANCQVH